MKQLLLLHGFLGAPSSWGSVTARLSQPTRVFTPWLVGHGLPPAAPAAADFEGEVQRLLRNHASATAMPAVLCGYSLGGRLALGLALAAPERFSKLVLVSAHPGLPAVSTERSARAASDAVLAEGLERNGLAQFVRDWEQLPLFATQAALPETVLARQRAQRLGHAEGALAAALRQLSLGAMPNYTERLAELRMPVRLVVGARDEKFRSLADQMHAVLPNSAIEVVADCGHNPVLERPEVLAHLLDAL